MSKKRIRAQLRKANNNHPNGKHDDIFDSYVLPATADAYEQMVEQMCKAWIRGFGYNMAVDPLHRKAMRLGLRAIGITAPKKGAT